MTAIRFNNPIVSRVMPFICFMALIAIDQCLQALLLRGIIHFDPTLFNWLYIPKVIIVGLMLFLLRQSYVEISFKDLRHYRKTLMSIFSGLLVFLLWINMDWVLGSQQSPAGFNPEIFNEEHIKILMIVIRVTGAVIIVPIMEELFWRSFLIRYLIDKEFTAVKIGQFTLFSFTAVTILFGLEHHYLFAGLMAGLVFNCVYYATRSIGQCILSHGVANFCLACYVLKTGYWKFW